MCSNDYMEEISNPNYYYKIIGDLYNKESEFYKQSIEAFETFLQWYGTDWLRNAAKSGHPLIGRFTGGTGIKKAIRLLNLIYYCRYLSGEKVFKEIKKRLENINATDLKSLEDELMFLWFFNENGFSVKKLLENNKKKNVDLEIKYKGNLIEIELTQLTTTDERNKANRAFRKISTLKHNYNHEILQSLCLTGRPWCDKHINLLEEKVEKALEDTIKHGYSSIYEENRLKYISWKPEYESQINEIHKDFELKKNKVYMDTNFNSITEPFRVRKKIDEKSKQANNSWFLIITSNEIEMVKNHNEIKNMISNVNEYMYEGYPKLVGCMLITWWGFAKVTDINYDSDEVSVITSSSDQYSHQQTIILKNIFSKVKFKEDFWSKLIEITKNTHWDLKLKNNKIMKDFR